MSQFPTITRQSESNLFTQEISSGGIFLSLLLSDIFLEVINEYLKFA